MATPAIRKVAVIIDDSPTTRKILEVCLRRIGIASLSFADGLEAITALRAQPHLAPSVVLMDIHLPRLNGFRVARKLRMVSSLRHTAMIYLSGYDSALLRTTAWLTSLGHDSYITKPFTTQSIVAAVSRYISAAEPVTLD